MNKEEYHKGTLKMLEESGKITKPYFYDILGYEFIILPGVFSPKYFKDTEFFAKEVPKYVRGDFLEIGSGTGIISRFVARKRRFDHIIATDINDKSVENTRRLLEFCPNCDVRKGDVYNPVKGERFDTIFWNVPFGDYDDGTVSNDVLKQAVFDPGHKNLERFIAGAPEHLNPNGNLLIGYSLILGDYEFLEALLEKHGMTRGTLLASSGYYREGNLSKPVTFELFESRARK